MLCWWHSRIQGTVISKKHWDQKGLLIIWNRELTACTYANSCNYVKHTFFAWKQFGDCVLLLNKDWNIIKIIILKYWLNTEQFICAFKLNHSCVLLIYNRRLMKSYENIPFDLFHCNWRDLLWMITLEQKLGDDMENTNRSHAWTHLPHQHNEAIICIKL